MPRKVVITGLGAISPLGLNVESTWKGLIAGQSGIDRVTQFDASEIACQIAGEVRGFDPTNFIDKKLARRLDRFVQFALVASQEAIEQANLKIEGETQKKTGVYIGSGIGGLHTLMDTHITLQTKGPKRVSPFFIPGMILNMASGQVSIETGAQGPNMSCATACATGCHAIGESYRMIRYGDADVMIAGGSEATVHPITMSGFASMKALSTRNDDPQAASRPFDQDRDGFVMGEGAGILILESEEHALARGANILAELTGYGLTGDAYHVSAPAEDGNGAIRAMKMALEQAEFSPSQIQYVNAHGTSTPLGDKIEIDAIRSVFGDATNQLSVASTKSMTGHLLGAAGGLESVATVKAIMHQKIPPTINHQKPEPWLDIDCVPNVAKDKEIFGAMNNSFGFGGTNACLVMQKPTAKQ